MSVHEANALSYDHNVTTTYNKLKNSINITALTRITVKPVSAGATGPARRAACLPECD